MADVADSDETFQGLTEEEREFILYHRGGIGDILAGSEGARGEAVAAARQLVEGLEAQFPNRAQRMVVLAAVASTCNAARNEVLNDILRGFFSWSQMPEDHWSSGEWRSLGVPDYLREGLATLAGMHRNTLSRRIKEVCAATMAEAQAAAGGDE